jgi:hypothetical protein
VIASLPCYSAKNVNLQRGSGVFQRSIDGLKILNSLGYGYPDTALELHLVPILLIYYFYDLFIF